MKSFEPISFDRSACKPQLSRFRKLLKSRTDLSEKEDLLPFFKNNKHLAAFMAGRFPDLLRQDQIAFEYNLFGDFFCDVVIAMTNIPCMVICAAPKRSE
jgi:hypothetical protein